jgi:hypothetical protein
MQIRSVRYRKKIAAGKAENRKAEAMVEIVAAIRE